MFLQDADMSYLSFSAYILNIYTWLCYNERVMNQLSVHQLPIQGLLQQLVSWLGQSKEYQELLEVQWLILICLLEMAVQEQLCYGVTKPDIYLQSTLCDYCFFLK